MSAPPTSERRTPAAAALPAERRPRRGELVLSVLLVALGAYLVLDARGIAVPGSSNTVGPRFFPYLVGGATALVGALLAIRILRGDRGPEEDGEDIDPDAPTSWRAVAIIAVAFLAHALLINVVGWPLAVTSMFGVVAWALGARGVVRPLIAGGITSVIIWLLFVKALGVVLPGGILLELATEWM
ncbi:putative tricarboxylic transport membrane protein [Friedmanniella luteola]|uniref:Putative tricarboxylic transport membrane protein n=1 Tax=Friedmanniella luteola TaxID=546871 RepID=A0A1H1ZBL1_9ACTN|nr:tripartite tricarboxylate transporter TctB family protein [Friedmanniella luteola]SDT31013.1 putative tricarboxylic transport membrane protein [Friedmanniella luteola]